MTANLTCLIVDDNPAEGKLLASVLGGALPKPCILVTQDGAEAITICLNERVDCVMVDYNMARMNGLELGARLRAELPYLPLVLMTSVGDEMLAAEALRNGFCDYIPKSKISRDNIARVIQRAVRATEQARVIDEQRTELEHFAYALAHDFKQPIRQIRTFVDLIGEELEVEDGSSAALHMGFLKEASGRLGALVDVMSQYTLLNKPPVLGVIDVDVVVEGVKASLAPFIAERNGVVVVESAGMVLGNEALMTQVLQNLVVNGLTYNTSATPRVTIRGEDGAAGQRRLVVADNGIGIEDRYRNEIFKPLMRLHASSQYPGSGLGLTIARKAVIAQGGDISCSSLLGVGSQFVLELRRPPVADGMKTAA